MSVNEGQGGSTHVSLSLPIVIFFTSSLVVHHHCGCLSSLGSSVIAATLHHCCLPVSIVVTATLCHHCPPVSIIVVWPLFCVVVNAKGGRGQGGDMAVGKCYVGHPCIVDTAGAHRHCGWCVVFASLVQSGFLPPKQATVNCNQSRTDPNIVGTKLDHLGPVFCSPWNWFRLVQTGFFV